MEADVALLSKTATTQGSITNYLWLAQPEYGPGAGTNTSYMDMAGDLFSQTATTAGNNVVGGILSMGNRVGELLDLYGNNLTAFGFGILSSELTTMIPVSTVQRTRVGGMAGSVVYTLDASGNGTYAGKVTISAMPTSCTSQPTGMEFIRHGPRLIN